jgi:hypothetical protein
LPPYPYRSGTHRARYAGQFRALLGDLARLHSAGYVFSDVREHNLVFHVTNPRLAWLVDFDLAGVCRVALPERADLPEASLVKRQPQHDLHALGWIMRQYEAVDSAQQEAWAALGASVMHAATAAGALERNWPAERRAAAHFIGNAQQASTHTIHGS